MAWKPKYPPDRPKRSRRHFVDALAGLAVVIAIVVAAVAVDRYLFKSIGAKHVAPSLSPSSVPASSQSQLPKIITKPNDSHFVEIKPNPNAPVARSGNPSGPIEVVDGDTVRTQGVTYRLVGFDTAERGNRARCERERDLAERATKRLQALIATGDPRLERTACACRAGTEGTQQCNFGRSCAYLRVSGRDVGETLIREGLAQPFVCGPTSCPPRRPWC